jgi:hypothetical protein
LHKQSNVSLQLTESYHYQYPILPFVYTIFLFALKNLRIDRELSYSHDCTFSDGDWLFRALGIAETEIE